MPVRFLTKLVIGHSTFWKGVKKLNQCNNIQAHCIEGKTGEKDIANHWKK